MPRKPWRLSRVTVHLRYIVSSPMLPSRATAEEYLDRVLPRIRRLMLVLAGIGTVALLVLFRWPATAGFVAGAVISYLNQYWLERAIEALGERIANQQSH